ncbi:MAG: hypothetical protein WA700_13855 [Acidobacteriaceae bacterium]
MKTLLDASVQREIRTRLRSLTVEDAARWGKMSAHQMICHLRDGYWVGLGEKKVAMVATPVPRPVMKWLALQTPLHWRHGFKSAQRWRRMWTARDRSSSKAIARRYSQRWSNFAII